MTLMGHYHFMDFMMKDNTVCAMLGAMAGESGYELMRQYSGAAPRGAVIHHLQDGRVVFETYTQRFLDDIDTKHPLVSQQGLGEYVNKAFTDRVSTFASEPVELQSIHQRTFTFDEHTQL